MSGTSAQRGISHRITKAEHYVWIVLPLVFGVQLADALTGQGIPVLYPFIQNEFGLSRAQVGLITSAYGIGGVAASVLAGSLTDSLGVKRIIAISLLSLTALTMAFLLANSWLFLLILVAFVGIASAPGYPATTRAVMDWLPRRIRALAMGLKQTGVPVGGAITAAVLPVLTVLIGWRMTAAVMSVLVLAVAVVFLLIYRDAPSSEVVRKSNFSALQTILRNRSLVISLIWQTTFGGLHYIALSYFMLFLVEELQYSAIIAGGLLAIAQVSSAMFRVLWGAASDFIFHGRRVVVLVISGFLTVMWLLGNSLMTVDVPTTAVFLTAIAIGISTLSYQGVSTTLFAELAWTGQVGATLGVTNMMTRFGTLIMPPLFGFMVDLSGSYALAWKVSAVVALAVTLILMFFVREPRRR